MKKTLITLAALAMASVASAADATLNTTDISDRIGAPAASDSYTWIAVMDWDTTVAALGNWQDKSRIYATDNWNTDAALGLVLFRNDSGQITLQFAEHNTDVFIAPNAATSTSGVTLSDDGAALILDKDGYSNEGKLAVSFSYDDTSKVYTFAALKADDTIGTVTFAKDASWDKSPFNGVDMTNKSSSVTERFVWYDEALTGTTLAYAAQTSIPEPTTATLSLLALAGLAARRRRK